ncbi:hypothetical protein S225a_05400 [Candidatus Brocadiaceae bacterium S225]|nr:hypothetical protein S225a_05400 [Candidatus Brocadiaceae bacterium S225]
MSVVITLLFIRKNIKIVNWPYDDPATRYYE